MYIPKSKIQSNLFTNGGEYLLNGVDYTGSYYLLYNGKAYTGIDQYDGTPELLVKYTPQNALTANDRVTDDLVFPFERANSTEDYSSITSTVAPLVQAPLQYFSNPSPNEISIGEMIRYFLKRFNDQRFVEVNEETYNSINNKDKKYAWELWIPFEVPWVIKGSEDEVSKSNKLIVYYTEERYKVRGLAKFLKNNFKYKRII
jgi:hypothetical protein